MRNRIRRFFAAVRDKLFALRVHHEIYGSVFPHIRGDANHGYPFASIDEMKEKNMESFIALHSALRVVERAASDMPRAEGEAFKHIMYRDLHEWIWQHIEYAGNRIQPDDCKPEVVATTAATT